MNDLLIGKTGQKAKPSRPSNETIAQQVINGAWGNGPTRKQRLAAAGYDYAAIQSIVNKLVGVGSSAPAKPSADQVANQIIAGQGGWGNNPERRTRLERAGYNYAQVQALVNRKLGL